MYSFLESSHHDVLEFLRTHFVSEFSRQDWNFPGHGRLMRVLAPAFAGFHESSEIPSYIGTGWNVLVVVEEGSEGGSGHERPMWVPAPAFAGFRESGWRHKNSEISPGRR